MTSVTFPRAAARPDPFRNPESSVSFRVHTIDVHSLGDLQMRSARQEDLDVILLLREHLSEWLRDKGLDQWQKAWPDEREQARRIMLAIDAGATLMVCDGDRPVGTMTLHTEDRGKLWSDIDGRDVPALYVSRMMVHRSYAGRDVGAEMLNWAEGRARDTRLGWIRLDAWTTNDKLHAYYQQLGFEFAGWIPKRPDLRGYPSAKLFQRRVRVATESSSSRHSDVNVSSGSRADKGVHRTTRS
jgi:GNAT superfamily N-acetyltransferase